MADLASAQFVSAGPPQAAGSLDKTTSSAQSRWGTRAAIYPQTGEAVIYAVDLGSEATGGERRGTPGEAIDPERSAVEAARRAKARLRRYVVANHLVFMWTLTFADEPESDEDALALGATFVERLRRKHYRGEAFPYVFVLEHGEHGGRRHLHMALGSFVSIEVVREVWGHGYVYVSDPLRPKVAQAIRAAGGTRARDPARRLTVARIVAAYVAKYLGKTLHREPAMAGGGAGPPGANPAGRLLGQHRYRVAKGFDPLRVEVDADSFPAALKAVEELARMRPEDVRPVTVQLGDEVRTVAWFVTFARPIDGRAAVARGRPDRSHWPEE